MICDKVWRTNMRYDQVLNSAEASLRRLNTSYFDLYLVRLADPNVPIKETMAAMERLVKEGKARAIGLSNFDRRSSEEARACLSSVDLTVEQVEYNLLLRGAESELFPYCKEAGLGIMAYSPLGQGILAGKYDVKTPPPQDTRLSGKYYKTWRQSNPSSRLFVR